MRSYGIIYDSGAGNFLKYQPDDIYGLQPLPPTSDFIFICYCVYVFGVMRLWGCGVLSVKVCGFVGLWVFVGLFVCVCVRICVFVFVCVPCVFRDCA